MEKRLENLGPASEALFNAIVGALQNERGVHIETAIAGAGCLAGAALLRNTGIDLSGFAPGSVILVDSVNEAGPELVSFLEALCRQAGLGKASDWLMEVPDANQPQLDNMELLEKLQPAFDRITTEFEIEEELAAYAAVQTAARLINAGQQILDPDLGKTLAVTAMVESSKTVPPAGLVPVAA